MEINSLFLQRTREKPNPDDAKEKQWQDVVEEMSIAAGIPLPKAYVTDDPDPMRLRPAETLRIPRSWRPVACLKF